MTNKPAPGPAIRPTLFLYIAGDTPSAKRALDSRKRLIEATAGAIGVDIIDVLDQPAEAEAAGILATPTLSDNTVAPPRRMIGDISNIAQVLEFFGYSKKDIKT